MKDYTATARHDLLVTYDHAQGEWSATSRRFLPDLAGMIRRQFARAAAAASFPNNQGNYTGKRTPRPAGRARTPAERFARLQATYLMHCATYRNPPTSRDCAASCRASRLGSTQHKANAKAA